MRRPYFYRSNNPYGSEQKKTTGDYWSKFTTVYLCES